MLIISPSKVWTLKHWLVIQAKKNTKQFSLPLLRYRSNIEMKLKLYVTSLKKTYSLKKYFFIGVKIRNLLFKFNMFSYFKLNIDGVVIHMYDVRI